jgi:transcriptional regulator with XRE-family HTH domain
MDGKRIKKALIDAGVSQAELAEFMGTSPQNVNAALQSDNIKTGTLEQVAKFLGKPVSFFYGDGNVVATDNAVAAGNDANVGLEASALLGELKAQRKLTEQAMSQNDRLLGIIESMQKI